MIDRARAVVMDDGTIAMKAHCHRCGQDWRCIYFFAAVAVETPGGLHLCHASGLEIGVKDDRPGVG